jgi:hypothetical protein
MRRSSFFVVPVLAAASLIVGCGSDEKNKDVFSCSDVPIANGSQTICEAGGAFGSGKAPYACLPGSVVAIAAAADGTIAQADCPAGTTPSSAGGGPDGIFLPGEDGSHDYPIGTDGANASGGTNGTSDGANASGGTNGTSNGSTTSGGTNGTSNGSTTSGGTNGSSTGSTTSGSSSSSGGAAPPGGGGYQCANDGASTTCVSTTCAAGHHVSSCGACVPDSCNSCACPSGGALGCTYTQGYWKTHPSAWPVAALSLGGKIYTKAELLTILGTPPRGDASLILGHQLITTLLDVKSGASSAPIAAALGQALAWMDANSGGKALPYGVPSTSAAGAAAVALSAQLDAYNNGNAGVPHCN